MNELLLPLISYHTEINTHTHTHTHTREHDDGERVSIVANSLNNIVISEGVFARTWRELDDGTVWVETARFDVGSNRNIVRGKRLRFNEDLVPRCGWAPERNLSKYWILPSSSSSSSSSCRPRVSPISQSLSRLTSSRWMLTERVFMTSTSLCSAPCVRRVNIDGKYSIDINIESMNSIVSHVFA